MVWLMHFDLSFDLRYVGKVPALHNLPASTLLRFPSFELQF